MVFDIVEQRKLSVLCLIFFYFIFLISGWWLVNTEYEEGYAPGTFLQKTDGQEEEQMFTCNGKIFFYLQKSSQCTQPIYIPYSRSFLFQLRIHLQPLRTSLNSNLLQLPIKTFFF